MSPPAVRNTDSERGSMSGSFCLASPGSDGLSWPSPLPSSAWSLSVHQLIRTTLSYLRFGRRFNAKFGRTGALRSFPWSLIELQFSRDDPAAVVIDVAVLGCEYDRLADER